MALRCSLPVLDYTLTQDTESKFLASSMYNSSTKIKTSRYHSWLLKALDHLSLGDTGFHTSNSTGKIYTVSACLIQAYHKTYRPVCIPQFSRTPTSSSLAASSHVLVYYDPSQSVILESDASQYGIGAVTLHRFPIGDERPIAYASRSLNSSQRNYSQIEREGLAIIFGVTKYYMYLFGPSLHFEPITNHC